MDQRFEIGPNPVKALLCPEMLKQRVVQDDEGQHWRKSQYTVFESRTRNLFADSIILLFVCWRRSGGEIDERGESEKVFQFAMI